jgi:Tol biopolymer transport system component
MRKTLRAKYIASEIHALLFISMWIFYSVFSQPLMDGLSALPFLILFVADLPISFVAFGVLFTSTKWSPVTAVLWGALGTLWWYAIGYAIDARIRNYRKKHGKGTEQVASTTTGKIEFSASRKKELLIVASAVALVIVSSLAWQWNGRQGSFDKGKIGNFAFGPGERTIVLVRSQGNSSQIESVALASGTSAPVGMLIPCTASSPTYSPDGKQIAFVCGSNSNEHSRNLIMDADGSNLHPLFPSKLDHDDFAPDFTSNGNEICFARSSPYAMGTGGYLATPTTWDVYSATIDGTNERPLTNRHFELFGLAFSGNGRKLIVSGDTGTGTRLNLYSLDDPSHSGIVIQPVIPSGSRGPVISNVSISSDGRSIYFMAASDGKKGFDYDVYRADLSGNVVEKLTTANGYATDLCVCSDGKTAVFLRWTSRWGSLPNLTKLYTLDVATKRVTALNVTGTQ